MSVDPNEDELEEGIIEMCYQKAVERAKGQVRILIANYLLVFTGQQKQHVASMHSYA